MITGGSSGNQPYWRVEVFSMVQILAKSGSAMAAVGGQKGKQPPNALQVDGIEDVLAVSPGGGELGALKQGQRPSQRRRCETQGRDNVVDRATEWTPAHQEPKQPQPGRVGEYRQNIDSKICLHWSPLSPWRAFARVPSQISGRAGVILRRRLCCRPACGRQPDSAASFVMVCSRTAPGGCAGLPRRSCRVRPAVR